MDFEARYKKLNSAQQTAVDTIDGPVMVVAGPGTGKTELLGMRTANILKKTDTLPENILCLTFTDAGSIAMKKRLTDIIGREAYNVSVYTFHAFGSEIMGRYREYFFNGASFQPADDLARHKIVTEILDTLSYNDPLRSKMNGEYTSIKDILSALSDLKRSGLTDAEFGLLLDSVQATTEAVNKILGSTMDERISKKIVEPLKTALPKIEAIVENSPVTDFMNLKDVVASSLRHALEDSSQHEKVTPPLKDWKDEWWKADENKNRVLKVGLALPRLRSLTVVYGLYLQRMQEAELYDYDDMIMQVVHAMEVNDELRYDLQEKYQFIMVDEFQDTNMAQMRILHNLTNNPVAENKPNVLVVGDDDQAIYGFQGADVGNILNFRHKYPTATMITLTTNYRSVQPILDGAREAIIQGEDRLENHYPELDKKLTAFEKVSHIGAFITRFDTPHDERQAIATSIRKLLDSGTHPSEIAVIAYRHKDLVNLISYLTDEHILINYERRDNVLDDESVTQIEHIGKVIRAIGRGNYREANALLPELLAHPAWNIDPIDVWKISLEAHKDKRHWLEVMETTEATKSIFSWLVTAASQAQHLPLERMLDIIIGNTPLGDFTSPFKEFFFSDSVRQNDLSSYSAHLNNLTTIRTKLREHTFGKDRPLLGDFLDFIAENRTTDTDITSTRHIGEDSESIHLLSGHKSKGLEFDHVFVINSTDARWGEKARGKSSTINFPPNLRLRQIANSFAERLRLFYVAMTRARKGLYISYAAENDTAKEMLPASFLTDMTLERREGQPGSENPTRDYTEHQWYQPMISIPQVTMRDLLASTLKHYKLSATHINNFVDVTNGGPRQFLLNNLLHFPGAMGPNASFGSAVHNTLQNAHDHIRATGQSQHSEDILQEFERQMNRLDFTDQERDDFMQRGSDSLRAFLRARYADFNSTQFAELDFSRQDVYIDEVHLTGKLDVVEFNKDEMTARVTDYKTGGVLSDWGKGSVYDKIKSHKYRQQLLFYKLLVENSREWRSYTVNEGVLQFVEPDAAGHIQDLRLLDINTDELEKFTKLIHIVWKHIVALDFPDTSDYKDTVDGVKQFEQDLLEGKV